MTSLGDVKNIPHSPENRLLAVEGSGGESCNDGARRIASGGCRSNDGKEHEMPKRAGAWKIGKIDWKWAKSYEILTDNITN